MIDSIHLLNYIIRPVLQDIGLWSEPAERLVLGTACAESDCGRWLKQIGSGPALGIYQTEPATYQDYWVSFLQYRPHIAAKVLRWSTCIPPDVPEPRELVGNLNYATAMCRIHYLRFPEPIPSTLPEQAYYWKRFYNSELGRGTVAGYLSAWNRFVPTGVV